jgi:hypothetical protein
MMQGWILSFAVACASVLAGCQSAPMLPSEFADREWMFAGLREPSLSSANAGDGFSRRIRIVVIPPYQGRPKVAVRLDQGESGLTTGVYISGEEVHGRWAPTERRRFSVSADAVKRLDELIRDAGIWEKYQFELREGGCTGGSLVLLERVSAKGYQNSLAYAPCGTSREYLDVVHHIAGLAGRQLDGWFAY